MNAQKGDEMAQLEYLAREPQEQAAGTNIQGVRDDILAIFGPDQRLDQPIRKRAKPVTRKASQRLIIAALSVGGSVTAIALGVFGGWSVFQSSSGAPAEQQRYAALQSAKVSTRTSAKSNSALDETQPDPVVASDLIAAPSNATSSLSAALPGPASSAREVALKPQLKASAARGHTVAPIVTSVKIDRPVEADDHREAIPSYGLQKPSCLTVGDCIQEQLRDGERDVAVAYERATLAGVRSRTLSEYRDEWIRARRLAQRRPQEAGRIYAMIASDLGLLAADPTIE